MTNIFHQKLTTQILEALSSEFLMRIIIFGIRATLIPKKKVITSPRLWLSISIIMFANKAYHVSYFQANPSLRIITDAKDFFNLDLEYSFAKWLKSDIWIAHFKFLNLRICYAVTWTHSFSTPGVDKNSIQIKKKKWNYELK